MLIVKDAMECLYSKEGVTRDNPWSMLMYLISTLSLVYSLLALLTGMLLMLDSLHLLLDWSSL